MGSGFRRTLYRDTRRFLLSLSCITPPQRGCLAVGSVAILTTRKGKHLCLNYETSSLGLSSSVGGWVSVCFKKRKVIISEAICWVHPFSLACCAARGYMRCNTSSCFSETFFSSHGAFLPPRAFTCALSV